MGYYTKFKLQASDTNGESVPLPHLIDAVSSYLNCCDGDRTVATSDYEHKWYSHEIDLRDQSLVQPDLVFVLDGDGEEDNDVWRKFFYRGRTKEWQQLGSKRPWLTPEIFEELSGSHLNPPVGDSDT